MVPSPIILALDRLDRAAALALAARVAGRVHALKIHDLYLAHGPGVVAELKRHAPVWVDLKFHDIPATVAAHARRMVDAGADFFTVHASGGPEMCAAAVDAGGVARVIAVTVLTSLDEHAIRNVYGAGPEATVRQLAHLAVEGGVRALVCSPLEARALRDDPVTAACRRITPGIQPAWLTEGRDAAGERWAGAADQARVAAPRAALDAGATYLVIGRAIVGNADPSAALDRTLAEIGVLA